METENISDYDSYSPITTPFGYFGGSLSGNRRAVGNMNFSMWAAGGNAKTAPPLSEMPHLLAVGHPKAEFGGFGHEGSGVKVRNWEPLAHHPKSIIQALRMDVVDGQATYSGYLFDDRVNQWRLYAVGRRPLAKQKRRNVRSPNQDNLRIASFCEIPGPASNERTGDRQRTIRRRGWVMDADGGWHAIDRQTRSVKPNAGPVNQAIAAGKSGWFHMSTGGVEMLDTRQAEVRLPKASPKLPAYLQKDVAAKLFQYPADIGQSSVTSLTSTSATVSYTLASVGHDAQAVLYYGPQDCLSFVARKDFHATERKGVIDQVFSKERTWQASTQAMSVANGENSFSLTGLKPNNTYFYRLLLTNRDGKIWSFDAGHFQSAKE